MLEREKRAFLCIFYIVCLALIFFGFKWITNLIKPSILATIALAFLYLFVIPAFRTKYYQFYSLNSLNGIRCFIPVYNEISMFTSTQSILYLISLLTVIIPSVLFFINPADLKVISGGNLAFSWGTGCLVALLIAIVFHSVVKGIAWVEICHDINRQIDRDNNTPKEDNKYHFIDSCFVVLQYLFLFIPLFRAISICFEYSRLKGLTDFRRARFASKRTLNGGAYHE